MRVFLGGAAPGFQDVPACGLILFFILGTSGNSPGPLRMALRATLFPCPGTPPSSPGACPGPSITLPAHLPLAHPPMPWPAAWPASWPILPLLCPSSRYFARPPAAFPVLLLLCPSSRYFACLPVPSPMCPFDQQPEGQGQPLDRCGLFQRLLESPSQQSQLVWSHWLCLILHVWEEIGTCVYTSMRRA